jgi:transcriptional regulator with XRE-family HTH domain
MRIESRSNDDLVLEELGRRISRTRLERNLSQAGLALEAGVAKTTVERLEAGGAVKTNSLVRVLRALGMLEALDRLIPEPLPSPIERRKLQGRSRRRAGGPRTTPADPPPRRWQWGDAEGGAG